MTLALERTALMEWLREKNNLYYAKIIELRDCVSNWLAYIPHTFPHYTRHTVQHSEEIVRQLSFLLFHDGDSTRPAIPAISAVEMYILAAAALLHDAGMVASDAEKSEILASDDWRRWVVDGGGKSRWEAIQAFRNADASIDPSIRNFLADVQTRFLISEFIRAVHHARAGRLLVEYQSSLGRFAFDDPTLLQTIADVCVSHGLRHHELENPGKYPDRRTIRGEQTNVRFLALLLRLGDLLDLSYDRACPLLLNAACPIPADSYAHWSQFGCITHRLIAPDRIEISAQCTTQDEHRILHDWCMWLVNEAKEAGLAMLRAERHSGWKPPLVSVDGDAPTITIRPAETANYYPSTWNFELDRDATLELLIRDAYEDKNTFVRELIQNAADASRCALYLNASESDSRLDTPTQFDEQTRSRYPISVVLTESPRRNDLSGEMEARQTIIVEDLGIGMDQDVICRYFLQVGRSFYKTDDFRRMFRFVPTSRFGVGFLTTFAVSDHITIETYKPSCGSKPIRLRLRGPRSYLLTEQGTRSVPGTRIEVLLREPMPQGKLTQLVRGLCKRLEFPVIVDDLGQKTTLYSERSDDFIQEHVDLSRKESTLQIQSFPVERPGIEGNLYVFVRSIEGEHYWDSYNWAENTYSNSFPQGKVPNMPRSLACFHGLAIGKEMYGGDGFCARVDYRGKEFGPEFSRQNVKGRDLLLDDRWNELLAAHLATKSKRDWSYRQRLIDKVGTKEFWLDQPGTIRVYLNSAEHYCSISELNAFPVIGTLTLPGGIARFSTYEPALRSSIEAATYRITHPKDIPLIIHEDLVKLCNLTRSSIFGKRTPKAVNLDGPWVACRWEDGQAILAATTRFGFLPLPWTDVLGVDIPTDRYRATIIVNTNHPMGKWVFNLSSACEEEYAAHLKPTFERLLKMIESPIEYNGLYLKELNVFIDGWRNIEGLPEALRPPEGNISNLSAAKLNDLVKNLLIGSDGPGSVAPRSRRPTPPRKIRT